ncbi:hypothetical protein ACP70R_021108 [Stipagrostis hirtigluma subsp. patula]
MEAEAAALSQLQLQLLALVSELRLLRERERGAREELRAAGQRWEEAEEERRGEARELRAEVAARDDALRRLEARIKCLENENELLVKNESNLKESMDGLLQSREAFIKHYEDSVCSMQWTIQMKDKQIAVISEKLNSHLILFSTAEKEVAAVKQVLGDVQCLVGEKENVVADLKSKVERVSVLEKDFVDKLNFLENKISSYQLELRNRARIIYELKDRLEAEKLNNSFQPQLEEIYLRKALSVKDEIIERLTSEKQAMHMELHNMEIALRKFQEIFSSIGHEGMKGFSPGSESLDVQDVPEEQLESIPGTQCGRHNEQTFVTAVDEAATTPNIEHQVEINPGSTQVQSPLKSTALPSPEPLAANIEPADCVLESRGDIDTGNLSPVQPTDTVKPDPNSESQS